MKLTVTNSSIDFFVPIDYVHQAKLDEICSVLTRIALRTGRATGRDDLWSVWMPRSKSSKATKQIGHRKTCKLNRVRRMSSLQLLENNVCCCVLPTWWLLRGGCTRSHSEHGRETPQRQWYSVLRRGRVGRCQVCKTQRITINIFSEQKQTSAQPIQRAASAAFTRFRPHEIKANAHRVPRLRQILKDLLRNGHVPHRTNNGILPSAKTRPKTQTQRVCFVAQVPRTCAGNAGWSSPVARQAHNLKAAGSNPAPATNETCKFSHSKYLRSSSSSYGSRSVVRLASVSISTDAIRAIRSLQAASRN